MVPLDFRVPSLGRERCLLLGSFGREEEFDVDGSWTEEPEDDDCEDIGMSWSGWGGVMLKEASGEEIEEAILRIMWKTILRG